MLIRAFIYKLNEDLQGIINFFAWRKYWQGYMPCIKRILFYFTFFYFKL